MQTAKIILKMYMWIYKNPLASQNSSPIGMSLSGIIFNLKVHWGMNEHLLYLRLKCWSQFMVPQALPIVSIHNHLSWLFINLASILPSFRILPSLDTTYPSILIRLTFQLYRNLSLIAFQFILTGHPFNRLIH